MKDRVTLSKERETKAPLSPTAQAHGKGPSEVEAKRVHAALQQTEFALKPVLSREEDGRQRTPLAPGRKSESLGSAPPSPHALRALSSEL